MVSILVVTIYEFPDWVKNLNTYAYQYNTGLHQSLGMSPFEALFCRAPYSQIENFEVLPTSYDVDIDVATWRKTKEVLLIKILQI